MQIRGILITAALLPLVACGGGSGGGDADVNGSAGTGGSLATVTAPRAANDSVSAPSSAPGVTSVPSPATVGEAPAEASAVKPSSVVIDLEARRILLPNEGWLSPDAFWDLYYHHPERVPEGIDFAAINQLAPMPPAPTGEP